MAGDSAGAPLVLGLDGGGSKTLLAVARPDGEARLLARGGGINPLDDADWRDELAAVLAAAAPALADVRQAVLGLPAYGEVAAVSRDQEAAVAALLAVPALIQNDVAVAFEGAFADRPGVLILAGTGSMAWGGDGAGRSVRVGGWGDGFGDEGSAWWIGHEAVSLTSRVLDGRRAGRDFAAAILAAAGLPQDDAHGALIGWYYGLTRRRAEVASLARVVDLLAEQGDALAAALLGEAADHLALHVEAAGRRLGMEGPPAWSFAGGVFASRTLLRLLAERLGAPPQAPLLPPIGGALWRAARAAGWRAEADWIARLAAAIAAWPPAGGALLSVTPESRK
jgi:N-acetylglucosamine kinase-like BadF-type ATPase